MDIQKILKDLQKEINQRLEKFFREKLNEYQNISSLIREMMLEIRDFIMGDGKRIRPIFVYWGYCAAGGKNKKAVLNASIFAELIHNYFLVHDDIFDQDVVRHGRPTLHTSYETKYETLQSAKHLGVCAGIIAGDLILPLGYEVLVRSKFPDAFKTKAIAKLNKIIAQVIMGQQLDVFAGISSYLEGKEIFKTFRLKTASYTIEGPLQIGAILAGADSKTLKILSQYGLSLGMAFQIQDDILGMFGDERKTGKSASSDLREGKQTLLIAKARKVANQKQRKFINQALGNPNLTKKQLGEVRKIIIDTGSLKYSQDLAKKLTSQAKFIIGQSSFSKEVKKFLSVIPDYIIKREK